MRTASDVLTNPKPGDIIDIEPNWRRWVRSVSDGVVIFDSENSNGKFDCAATLDGWRIVCQLPTIEVIHVAE
jgi:hypothetical protein